MRISVIGAGYVGLSAAVSFALLKHKVTCIDIDQNRINQLKDCVSPFFEPKLQDSLKTISSEFLSFSSSFADISQSDLVFICVGTPNGSGDIPDASQLESAVIGVAHQIGGSEVKPVIILKSTALPGSAKSLIRLIESVKDIRFPSDFGFAVNPEFLRQGSALADSSRPDYIVVGTEDRRSKSIMSEFFSQHSCPVVHTCFDEAHMIKYAANAFLATKISFANEISDICSKLNIDSRKVISTIGLDSRIARGHLNPGIGFGGSCLPKDLKALISKASQLNVDPLLLSSVDYVNSSRIPRFLNFLEKIFPNLSSASISVLGVSFKAGTDDVRCSPAVSIIEVLSEKCASITIFDPKATSAIKRLFPKITCTSSAQESIDQSDLALILSDWNDFRNLDYRNRPVVDARSLFLDNDTKPEKFHSFP